MLKSQIVAQVMTPPHHSRSLGFVLYFGVFFAGGTQAGEMMRDFFDRTKLYWTTEIIRRREEAAKQGDVKRMTEKVGFIFVLVRFSVRCVGKGDELRNSSRNIGAVF